MNQGTDHLQAGRQLLELQLAMMRGAMTLMADGAQRIAELGLGAAAAATRGASTRREDPPAPAPASAAPRRKREAPAPSRAADRLSSKDYALRMQEDVDSILHAFAMVPDAADRLIRTSALLTEKPGDETAARQRRSPKPAPARARRPARREAGEHAR